jgi:hypothetical protein
MAKLVGGGNPRVSGNVAMSISFVFRNLGFAAKSNQSCVVHGMSSRYSAGESRRLEFSYHAIPDERTE